MFPVNPPPTNPFQYKVNRGDTLLSIADKFKINHQDLLSANKGGYPFVTGQTIRIPQAVPSLNDAANQQIGNAVHAVGNVFQYATKPTASQPKPTQGQGPSVADRLAGFFGLGYVNGDAGKPVSNSSLMPLLNAAAPKPEAQKPATDAGSPTPLTNDYQDGPARFAESRSAFLADFNNALATGNVPDSVDPYQALYINNALAQQNLPPIYDAQGKILDTATTGQGGTGSDQSAGGSNPYRFKIGQDYYRYVGHGGFQARPGTPGNRSGHNFRNSHGSILHWNNKRQHFTTHARKQPGQNAQTPAAPQNLSGVGLVDFRVGSG